MDQSGERPIHPWVAEGQRRVRFGVGTVGARRADAGFLAWARRVEALGFDSYWVQDHPLSGPDCWTSLTALALATERLRLGTLVCCGYYRSPTLLVRQAADVDRLSGGRLVLGFGHGDAEDEFRQMGLTFPPVPERQALLEETLRVVRGLWSGEPFTLEGTHVRVRKARLAAGPIQRPHVPLPIAGGGERVTLRQVARYGDVSNFGEDAHAGGVRTPDDVRRRLETLRGHCAAGGRPYEAILTSHLALPLIAAATPGAVAAKLDARFGALPPEQQARRRAAVLAGTPNQLIARYRQLVEAGLRYFIAAIDADDAESLELLGERVMPEVARG